MIWEEFILSIMGIIAGTLVISLGIAKISGLIKAWIERDKNRYDEETFNRLAKAFMEHKKEMERRVNNLESIAADENDELAYQELEEPGPEHTLSNQLNEKRRVK